ncbi:MAG TPA: PQQ-binding-like beta-propeller repeat protein [Ktedonobacteraceae bacterium]|nr:PQQ-binding-like beta-propeller repeat protein [Ktedonobacteraceae bacterium]
MNTQNNAACTEWSEQLAALHPDDLSSAERAAREAHIASCNTCSTVRRQYAEIAELVRTLPTETIPEELPARLVAKWDEEEKQPQSGHFSRPQILSTTSKRRRRGRFVAVLIAAALVVVAVLGSFLVHRGSESTGGQPGQINSGPSGSLGSWHNSGVAMVPGRFFSIHGSVIYMPEENGSGLLALDKNTGALIRRYKIGDGKVLNSPVIAGDILYDVDLETSTLYAVRIQDGSAVWHKTFGNHLGLSVSFADGIVYVITSAIDHQIYALQPGNGHVLWHYQTRGTNSEIDHVIAANGIAYISSNDGNVQHLYALNTTNGRVLWTHQFSKINAPDLLTYNGVLYVTSGNTLLALQAESGATLWTYRVDNASILTASTVVGNILYMSGNNGYIYALHIEDGTLLWRIKVANNTFPSPPLFLSNGLLLVESAAPTGGSTIFALNAENGQIKWQKNYNSNGIPTVNVDNGIIYISLMTLPSEKLEALRAEDGSIIWSKSLNGL